MKKNQILTKKHNCWEKLIVRLENALNKSQNGSFGCHGDLRHTKKILKSLSNIDVKGTIKYLKDHGGFCDCEVLMNVAYGEIIVSKNSHPMTEMEQFCDSTIWKAEPPNGSDLDSIFNEVIFHSLCPYCENHILTAGDKEEFLIAYCPVCDMVWKAENVPEENCWFVDEIGPRESVPEDS